MSIYKMRTVFQGTGCAKWIMGTLAIIFVIGAVYFFGPAPTNNSRRPDANKVIAKVLGQEITKSQFDSNWQRQIDNAASQGRRSPLQMADVKLQVLAELIQSRKLLKLAEDMGVDISGRKVEEEIENQITEYLKSDRRMVLSDVSADEDRTDPRKDRRYINELQKSDLSLSSREAVAKEMLDEDQVRAQLAQQGLQEMIKQQSGNVSQEDVDKSYDTYTLRRIVLMIGKLSEDQTMSKAQKVVAAAKGGSDFAKLVAENSDYPDKTKGGLVTYSFDGRFVLPNEVQDVVKKMKPGEVSEPVKSPAGAFIVKLESVVNKKPAKLDAKAIDARKKAISEDRQYAVAMDLQGKLTKMNDVQVLDPELRGYWAIAEAQRNMDPNALKKAQGEAITDLTTALAESQDNKEARAKLAQLYYESGKFKDAATQLAQMLEGDKATVEAPDLRILLGDVYTRMGDKKSALDQYNKAAEGAMGNTPINEQVHNELIARYKQMGRKDLVAAENQWMAKYKKETKQWEEMQKAREKASAPKPLPVAKPKPGEKPAPAPAPKPAN